MIGVLKKIWRFAGKEQANIGKSIFWGFFYAVFHMLQVAAIYFVVLALTGGEQTSRAAWLSLLLLAVSIVGRALVNRFTQLQQTHAGYFMVADRRVAIGDKLKRVPMGDFSDRSLGEITGVTTTVLDVVETVGPVVLVNILSGFINAVVFMLCVFAFDWRVGLLALAGTLLYLAITAAMEKRSAAVTPRRQESEAQLVDAVLEQLQGMSVIKSFNLAGKGDRRLREALEYNRQSNLAIEKLFTPYNIAQSLSLNLFSVLIMGAAALFFLNGAMPLADALMTVVIAFMVFAQIQSAGSAMSSLRLVGASIDHADQINALPEMDEKGGDVHPRSHDIAFDHVNFSYDRRPILRDVSLTIPDKTTTAIIGPSGSGKTTLCNLIARFWDVDGGAIRVGGTDVRDYTLESLMEQVSMVFQRVYLFADTIENNIRFGRPQATHEEVVAAAKKACCHDFIMALPDGYDAVIGEGGATLSGGEKQRISIARAMLKDAPIIIFDEATANVDPENEDKLQQAMEALTRDKTILMIAHRLKTVREAEPDPRSGQGPDRAARHAHRAGRTPRPLPRLPRRAQGSRRLEAGIRAAKLEAAEVKAPPPLSSSKHAMPFNAQRLARAAAPCYNIGGKGGAQDGLYERHDGLGRGLRAHRRRMPWNDCQRANGVDQRECAAPIRARQGRARDRRGYAVCAARGDFVPHWARTPRAHERSREGRILLRLLPGGNAAGRRTGDGAFVLAQSQILCKLPTRREQIRIQCARQRIYPTAACVQYNAGGDGCQGRRQGRRSSERRAAARRPLTSGPGGVIRACVRQNRWTAVRESGSSPAAVPSTFS